MWSLLFPPKKFPEDTNEPLAYLARLVIVLGIFCLCFSGWRMLKWARTMGFATTTGQFSPSGVAWKLRSLEGAGFRYTVGGQDYESTQIAIGGRPWGALPASGPITVYYNPANPQDAVVQRFPIETTWMALGCAFLSVSLARKLWAMA